MEDTLKTSKSMPVFFGSIQLKTVVLDFLILQDKHNIHTLSVKLKL